MFSKLADPWWAEIGVNFISANKDLKSAGD
jgi:hypothetical protein